ncbi:sulfotransferase [Maritimibacter sp. DP1N21-5]|uniref:sulfotransferase family protein n=1 Tax=Maritimibacter sp. DP1N21-5 TaxID=2836867 RepID=UPI001C45666D|nr:sulfotransferase [Maritimibacter sp. DP1N21-5]
MKPPVFILGLQRSGTTWLANQLAAVAGVAAVQHPDHHGVHESVFFSHFARHFSDWHDPGVRAAFAEAFFASDYARLTGLDPDALLRAMEGAGSPAEVFRRVMEAFCAAQGADLWIEKSPHHTLLAAEIRVAIPEARFLMVERALVPLVQSRLHGFGRDPKPGLRLMLDIIRGTVVAVLYRREMRRLARRGQGMLLRYEDLLADDGPLRTRLLAYMDLPSDSAAMTSRYAANSSFSGKGRAAPGPGFRVLVGLTAVLAGLVPLSLLRRWQLRRDKARAAASGGDWPDWVWSQTGYRPRAASTSENNAA